MKLLFIKLRKQFISESFEQMLQKSSNLMLADREIMDLVVISLAVIFILLFLFHYK